MIRPYMIWSFALLMLTQPLMAQTATEQPAKKQPGILAPMIPKQFPVTVNWKVVNIGGKAVSGDTPTMQLDKQFRMKGFSGCNTYSATAYPTARQGFAVGPIALTRKVCDKALMESEKNFLLSVRTSAQWEEKDGFLILRGQMGEIKFQRAL